MVTRSFVRGFIEKSYDALGAYEISRRYAFKGEFFIKEIKRFEIEWYITEKNIQLLHKESLDKSKFRGILKKFNPFK